MSRRQHVIAKGSIMVVSNIYAMDEEKPLIKQESS